MRKFFVAACLLLAGSQAVGAQIPSRSCNAPAAEITSFISLPARPYAAIPSADGCTIFVSMSSSDRKAPAHIAVIQRADGKISLLHDVTLKGPAPSGMALSHDGALLAASNGEGAVLFDVRRLANGQSTPLATGVDAAQPGGTAGSTYVAITPDDKLLFVSDEFTASLSVYDLARMRTGADGLIGRVPVGFAPSGLAISPDGRYLYSTSEDAAPTDPVCKTCIPVWNYTASQEAAAAWAGAAICPPEGGDKGPNTLPGMLAVIDVARAAKNPSTAVSMRVPAGCNTVRVALSAKADRAYATARGSNALLVFDTAKLTSNASGALIATVLVGRQPVGVTAAGDKVFVGNSSRYATAGRKAEWLSVIDSSSGAVEGSVPAGLFPRELAVTADGKTLLVSNFNSSNLELVDLPRLTESYFARQKPVKDADDAAMARAASTP